MTLWEYDLSLGIPGFCGVDEAGRGPLAGDVYAAAVILDPDNPIDGLNDSKKLTEKRREALFPVIQEKALAWSVGVATVDEIDTYNILQATFLAMRRAVDALCASVPELSPCPGGDGPFCPPAETGPDGVPRLARSFRPVPCSDFRPGLPGRALVDGNRDPGLTCGGVPLETLTVVHGDAVCTNIAAASVVAKVTRDRFMELLDRRYPQYGFSVHKGYPTKAHYDAVAQYGVSPAHRRSFFAKRPALLKVPYRGA